MPNIGLSFSMIVERSIRVRQNLPVPRQNIPSNYLKNHEKSSPASLDHSVQRSEAVCEYRIRHCGLEMRK
ncbi:hypothetical protein ACQR0V_30880 [Bradyrhizobium sp. HKCCYLS2058]|uniref:hypothetical protein n=1 Tax=Bradyrhizobium TaxID=374 RepID=UPI0028EF06B8|nr:hypothetical protein [Bradyrhizobium sp. SZCCHNS3002]